MTNNPQQDFKNIQPMLQEEIHRYMKRSNHERQYRVTKIPVHTHNSIDSTPVSYTDLGKVQSFLTSNTVAITSAQIKTLNSVPIVLVPPPTKRSVIIVHNVTARLTYSGTPYTGNHNLEFHYTDGSGIQVTDAIPPSFINSSSSAFYHAPAVTDSFAPIEGGTGANGQIVAFVNTSNPAAGNSTMTFVVHYHVVSFAT